MVHVLARREVSWELAAKQYCSIVLGRCVFHCQALIKEPVVEYVCIDDKTLTKCTLIYIYPYAHKCEC